MSGAKKFGVRKSFSFFDDEEYNSLKYNENLLIVACIKKNVTHVEYNALLQFWRDKRVRMLDLIAARLA